MPLADDVSSGDLRTALEAQRDDIARRLESADDRAAAALHQRLSIVLRDLDKLPTGREESKLDRIASNVTDELAERRANRQPGPEGAAGAGGGRGARS